MKKITLLLMMLLFAMFSFGQVSNYTFSQSSGTYTAITGGTVVTTSTSGTPNLDSYVSSNITIPSFSLNGTAYTKMFVTGNGQVALGTSTPSGSAYTVLSSTTGGNVFLAPLSADLDDNTGVSEIRYETIGNEFIVQWTNFRRFNLTESISFQVRMNTSTNVVKFVYNGTPPYASSTSYQPQVGIKSATGAGNYNALTVATAGNWNTPVNITTGIVAGSVCALNASVGPTSGLTYTWSPPIPCTGTPNNGTVSVTSQSVCPSFPVSSISVTGVTVAIGISYQWEQSTNSGGSWSNVVGGTNATTTTYSPPVFAGTTIQYRLKTTCSNSGLIGYSNISEINNNPKAIPFTETFTNIGDLGGWSVSGGFGIGALRGATGNPGNNALVNLYSTNTTGSITTQKYGPITDGKEIKFDYKMSNFSSPYAAPASGSGNVVVLVSTDCGATFTTVNTFTNDGIAGYRSKSVSLASYVGNDVVIRITGNWTSGDYDLSIDNLSIVDAPTCIVSTALSVSGVTATSANISWAAAVPAPGVGYQYAVTTSATPPASGISIVGNSTSVSTLNPSTTYYLHVRSECASGTEYSVWVTSSSFTTTQLPATLPYTQDFSVASNFSFVNGTQANKWFYGSAAGNPANSIYISSDVAGATNDYNNASISVTQAYRDIAIPSGTTLASLSFDWKANGESGYDYLRVWLVPTSFVPTAGTQIAAATGRIQTGGNLGLQSTWQTYTNATLDLSSFANSTMRLVYEWRNDGFGGTQNAAAIDNISLMMAPACSSTPVAGTVTPISTVSCTGALPGVRTVTGSTSGVSGLTYQWQESTDNFATTVADAVGGSGATTLSYTPPAYTANIQYRLRVTCTATSEIDYSTISQVNGAGAPTTQASNVLVSNALTSSAISWTNGNGGRRYVVVNTVNSFTDPSGTADVTGVSATYASGEQIVYDGTGSTVTVTGLASNTQYFVRVFEYARCTGTPNINYYNVTTGTNNPSTFTSAINNDVCANAITIACSESITTSLVGSTNENQAVCGISGVTTQNSAGTWYKFTGNGDDVTISTGSSATNVDTRLAVFSGTCAGLTCIGGNDDKGGTVNSLTSEVLFSTSVGIDYYILLYSWSGTSPTAEIVLTATCTPACAPATNNDVCANASSVVINTPLSTNNSCSSPSGVSYPTCGSSFGTFYDTWYSFNSGAVTSVQVSATPTTTALVGYAVYSGVCGTLTQVACNTTGVLSTVALTANTNYYVRVFSITPANRGDFTLNIIAPNTWTGITSTSWSDGTNWSLGTVPNGTRDVIIPTTANNPILATAFTVQTGKTLTISGTGALTLSPAASLTIQGTASFGGKSVTLQSDATGTAMLGEVTGFITGATNVTVERYIPAKRVWRALTAPLKGASGSLYATWQNGGTVTANTGVEIWGPAGTSMAVGPNYSVLNYTPTGWASVTNTTTANLFDATTNNAYLVFVTGGYGSGNIASTLPATATTLKATGSLITGDVAYTGLIDTKHTLIGNPYASSLNPSALLTGATNLINKFWVYDPDLGSSGGYVSYDAGLGAYSNSTGSYATSTTAVQSGQAFFVRATTSTVGSFTISENKKSTDVSNVFGKNANQAANNAVTASIFRVGFYKETSLGWNPLDGAIAGFYPTANNLVDENDGKKFVNGSENIAFVRNNTTLSSEHFLEPQPLDELYMRVWNTSVNNYKLRINTELFTVPNIEATLIDLFTGVQTPLALDGTIQEYPFAVTSASASTGDRFKVVFSASPLATTAFDTKAIKVYPNPVTNGIVNVQLPEGDYTNYSYELVNVLGQKVLSNTIEVLSGSQFSFNTRGLANTWYVLQLLNNGKPVYQTKVIIAN